MKKLVKEATLIMTVAIALAGMYCLKGEAKTATTRDNSSKEVITIEEAPNLQGGAGRVLATSETVEITPFPSELVDMELVETEEENSTEAEKELVEEENLVEFVPEAEIQEETVEEDNSWSAEFHVTAYCGCSYCSEGYGVTASGTTVTAGRTIAVDPDLIPLGSTVVINGHEYIAEDTGGAINGYDIDIYFESHQEALEFGVQYLVCTVYPCN